MQAETITLSLAAPPRPLMLTAPTRQHAEAPHGEADPPRPLLRASGAFRNISSRSSMAAPTGSSPPSPSSPDSPARRPRAWPRWVPSPCCSSASPISSLTGSAWGWANSCRCAPSTTSTAPAAPSERHRSVETPDHQRARLFEILRAKGLSHRDAADAAQIFARHPQVMAEMILAEETGLRDPDGESPARNGSFTFAAFITFGAVPLIPYLLFEATAATTQLSILATGVALVLLGPLALACHWRAALAQRRRDGAGRHGLCRGSLRRGLDRGRLTLSRSGRPPRRGSRNAA